MSTDQEPQPSNREVNYPPYLTQDELQQVSHSFTYNNFNVVSPSDQEPYLVITVPEVSQTSVIKAFTKSREHALNQLKQMGVSLAQADLPDEEARTTRKNSSDFYLPGLQAVDQYLFQLTLNTITLAAELGAQVNALRDLPDQTEPDKQRALYAQISRKQALIRRFSNGGQDDRYIFYCGEKVIYKTPADLENPYSPSSTENQN